jgi:hypothetical protein
MKRNLNLFIICLCLILKAPAQNYRLDHFSIALTTLHTDFPFGSFSGLFIKEFHPGFETGTGFNWSTKKKHDWFQAFQFSYCYHRFVQHSIALYSEFGYRFKFSKGFFLVAKVGGGYLHAIPVGKIFKLQEDGTYRKKANLGRPQVMTSLSLALTQIVSKKGVSAFLEYQQRLQLPFIKSYVPLLPSNIMMIGVNIPVKSK